MKPIALTICIAFIIYLFWMDRKNNNVYSASLWIPFIWMFIAGSRSVSQWLNLNTPIESESALAEAYAKGNTLDLVIFSLLIFAGIIIVSRRKIDWEMLFKKNKWIWFYFLYCGISIMWTDAPFVTFKRLIKEFGGMVILLIILSEKQPYIAIGIIIKRLSFLIVPLSVLFIWYYPDFGRSYDVEGNMMYTGVAQHKNSLGKDCLIIGIYFVWYYLIKQKDNFKLFNKDNILNYLLIIMLIWLLYMSHSATSLACLVVAICLFLTGRLKLIRMIPNRIINLTIASVVLFFILEYTMNISDFIIKLLGRDPTLTSRTIGWQKLIDMATNPIIGSGYMNFWSGDRLLIIWEKIGSPVTQSHNGYVEQYLNLGYIGVAFILIIILSGLFSVRKYLSIDYPAGMLRFCFIVIAVLYNYTEAAFYGINNLWFLLLFSVFVIPTDNKQSLTNPKHS